MHPVVNFIYFALVLTFAMWFTHPLFLLVSLICAFAYSIYLRGGQAVRVDFLCLVPLIIITALINPAFSHQGVTVLTYLPSGNPLTLESILYGLASGIMLAAVICWFSCLNRQLTSDKFVYLFGRIIPALSLVLSMTLRFVPAFNRQIKSISRARKGLDCSGRESLGARIRGGLGVLSAAVGWAMENAVETADSMKSRGYGLEGRTAYSIYRFDRRSVNTLILLLLCGGFVLACNLSGALDWRYYPSLRGALSPLTWAAGAAYALLCLLPLILDAAADARWRALRARTE